MQCNKLDNKCTIFYNYSFYNILALQCERKTAVFPKVIKIGKVKKIV